MSTIFFTDGVLANSISAETRLVLESLRERHARLGIIINRRERLQRSIEQPLKINSLFDPKLLIYSDTEATLVEAAAKARPDRALFVSEDSIQRRESLKAGFDMAIPHLTLVSELMEGGTLVYARVSKLNEEHRDGRLKRFLRMPIAPVFLSLVDSGFAYIITSTRITEEIRAMGFEVTTFDGHDPQVTDLYLARDDRKVPESRTPEEFATDFLKQQDKSRFIVGPLDRALLLALSDVPIEEIHFPNARHGHNRRLRAKTTLLAPLTGEINTSRSPLRLNSSMLTVDEVKVLQEEITKEKIEALHAPYVGDKPLVVKGVSHTIRSRHISQTDNCLVTHALVEQLNTIGGSLLKVQLCEFTLADKKFYNVEAELPGSEPDAFVIISAHFDSIARDVAGFTPAPGADDDASGMAGVLAAAQVAVRLRAAGPLKRSLRFLFFNAEEDFILGSLEYAARQRAKSVNIVAVFQMDMIGFNGGKPRVFEIHAGFHRNPVTESRSLQFAQAVSDMAAQVSPSLTEKQIYPRDNDRDPAEGYSDHTPFHENGYAACMISEDYNTDPGDPDPDPQINKDYHQSTDQKIDYAYAAEIARAVVAAAILTAKS
jgi:bacterial leucyl aminopeptidase